MTAPPLNRGKKFPPEILTKDEARRLLLAPSERSISGLRDRALIAIMYGAGLRGAEALALKPSDIDTDTASVRVLHGKGDKARTVGIDQGALIHVVRWIEARRAARIPGRLLFCTISHGTRLKPGGPMSATAVNTMLKRRAEKVGIDKRVHRHGLRHTLAVELDAAGFSATQIQKQFGHKRLDTTQVYLDHVSASDLVEEIRNRRLEI